MADSLDGKAQTKKMKALNQRDTEDELPFIDLFDLAKPEYRLDRVQGPEPFPRPVPSSRSSSDPSLSQHPYSRKRDISPVATSKGPRKKSRVSKGHQSISTMDSSSDLPGQPTPPSQGEAVCQPSSNLTEESHFQPQESKYTNLRFELDMPIRSIKPNDNVEGRSEQSTSTSHSPLQLSKKEFAALPDDFKKLYAETHKTDANSKKREKEKNAEKKNAKKKKITQKGNVAEKESVEQEKEAGQLLWPGDTSAYPAESFVFQNPAGSHLRAQAVHIGLTKTYPLTARISVFAVRQEGSADIEFRIARDGSTPAEIRQGPPIKYDHIRHNDFFAGMKQAQAELWARQLLAQVPGINDAIVKWK
ncbi:uncharacterized protein F4812DRAFT_458655 [Daldinia caldariorum]|uniref:uncharacterized protein n=1 Tax=Daldinia caldariorum TaxID=326644 RepID=UPI00200819A4|nr:uncharacterized protein F4812DRAFT_458655 [Daldinia caldariorum]KAI1468223.1 hypothetical protein F4812DRAFT_458655 [Daldinia caldariorum]